MANRATNSKFPVLVTLLHFFSLTRTTFSLSKLSSENTQSHIDWKCFEVWTFCSSNIFVLKENYYQHDSKLKAVVMYKTIDNNDDAKRNNNKAML